MTVTITLPDELVTPLEREAAAQQRSPADVALAILSAALEPQREQQARDLQALFKATQALPQAQALNDEDIAAEVAAHRSGG